MSEKNVVTVPLKKPIKAHGEEVNELHIAHLDGSSEILEFGLPVLSVISADGQTLGMEIRAKVVAKYICKLAQIPMGSVEKLHPMDFNRCAAVIQGFFGDGDGEAKSSTSSEPSTSPTSGA